ncbi:hypothetical protein FJY63_06640 [Candidatus Sumerlaeota bacterium]|nr:hypothetical protein [Candidatus Sumerlaeota bacterium]
MNVLVHLVTYAALLIFAVAIAVRFLRIRGYPLNLRWEIYPVPHEGKRAAHGGSKMEESGYWAREHRPDRITEWKFMLAEMVFIKSLFEHNRKLWYRSFPFHFGLYLLAAFAGLLGLGAILELAGTAFEGPNVSSLAAALSALTSIVGRAGIMLTIWGAVGLQLMRMCDKDLRPFTNFSHYFNLVFVAVVVTMVLGALLAEGGSVTPFRRYIGSLITFHLSAPVGGRPTVSAIVAVSLLIAYIPLTHMSHFFVKWFTWHHIRWDDSLNVRGGRIEKMIEEALQYRVSWSADHIRGNGKKTWAQVATEEMSNRG